MASMEGLSRSCLVVTTYWQRLAHITPALLMLLLPCLVGTSLLGSRGTVVGRHERAVEVLFDADYIRAEACTADITPAWLTLLLPDLIGTSPLGSRRTLVGAHECAVEVLFDADYIRAEACTAAVYPALLTLLLSCPVGTPPLGSRGTVVGIHEGAVEVLFDADYIGGGDLHGRCQGQCGGMLPPAHLLNLAKPHFSNLTGVLELSWAGVGAKLSGMQ